MSLELYESNPTIFLTKFIEAVNDGYRLQDTNAGVVQDYINNGWFQVALEKDEEYEVPFIQVGSYVIEAYDRQEFFRSVQSHVLNKAEFNIDSLYYDVRGIKMIKCVIRPSVSYTREALQELEWEQIKELGYTYGVFNRQRKVLENSLVRIFEEI